MPIWSYNRNIRSKKMLIRIKYKSQENRKRCHLSVFLAYMHDRSDNSLVILYFLPFLAGVFLAADFVAVLAADFLSAPTVTLSVFSAALAGSG